MSQTSQTASFRQRAHAITPIAPPIAPPNHTRPGAREERLAGVLDDEVELGADDAADERGEDHLVGPVHRLAELGEALGSTSAGRDEPEREHQTKGLESDGADVYFGLHGA